MSLPKAWGSDHATTLAVASGGPIVTAGYAWLAFRMSGYNISSRLDDAHEKLRARLIFARWLREKSISWYGAEVSCDIMQWFYLKGEYYVTQVWPFDNDTAVGLFELAEICGVNRTIFQKISIFFRGWISQANCFKLT